MSNRVQKLRGGAALLLFAFSASALAVDAREVIIDRQADLVISPEHKGHVLASPNRDFVIPYATNPQSWWIFEKPRKKAVWADRSYLSAPENARVLRTYFDFDKDGPIDTSAVLSILDLAKQAGMHYLLVGHADEVGNDSYNMQLSVRRAASMRSILVEHGIPESAIRVIGKGNHIPASLLNQSLNRRVEILVRGDKKQRADFTELVKEEARRAAQEKREREARERARQTQAAQQATAIYQQQRGAGHLDQQPASETPSNMTATQKALLPPVRLDQMGGGNPLDPIQNPEAHQ